MKKAFDANVSRARPRLRLGAAGTVSPAEVNPTDGVEAIAATIAREELPPSPPPSNALSAVLKERAQARARRPSAEALLHEALARGTEPASEMSARTSAQPTAAWTEVEGLTEEAPEAREAPPAGLHTLAQVEPPAEVVEVQTAPPPLAPPSPAVESDEEQAARRERLKSRLKAVRENPRPEPLPETVAAAGVLAVERIAQLQSELAKAREQNLALTQELEASRRQAERATEEARTRMDEARRLAKEMETRASLLAELERELEALEAERNEALIALQDSRLGNDAREKEKAELTSALAAKDLEVEECLAEEERLASELEVTRQTAATFRRSAEVLTQERDTLARQVAELTKERAELLEARKALEAVHRALSSAAVR